MARRSALGIPADLVLSFSPSPSPSLPSLGGAYWLDYTLATQPNNVITDTSMVNVVVQGLGGLCL